MSLPPGFLEELRSRVSLAQVVGRKVTWDQRRSNPSRGDWWAPCPFHQEKTASFHVDDRKGFYYCFGCHAKGDALTFLRESENLGFMESVELLAREAGMSMPARDPAAARREDRRATLAEVMEQAARFYRLQLASGAGADAREYLARRGIDKTAQERFGLGHAPDARQALWSHLTGTGVAPDLIVEAGLCARPDDGGAPYDRFRGRVIFPIRDARGRCVAFGGRALAEGARAKYLNSPETPLFDKGRTLYNIGPAREALGKGAPLIVAEGYMDVIALVLAGFEAAVAPLGTAVTEDQLRLLWRLADAPVVALDGDAAGLRAGRRLAEMGLGMMAAGQGLRFCLLPAGQDPDDVLRGGGPAAMQAVIDRALPLSEFLWQDETAGEPPASAEAIAALRARLAALAARAQVPALRRALDKDFGFRLNQLEFEQLGRRRRRKGSAAGAPLAGTRASALAAARGGGVDETLREARILAMLYAHPALIPRFEDALMQITPAHPDHGALFSLLIEAAADPALPGPAALAARAGAALETLQARPYIRSTPLLRRDADIEQVALCLEDDFSFIATRRAQISEVAEAEADMKALPDESLTWRLAQAAAALDGAGRARSEPQGGDDENDRARLSDHLQSLIDAEIWKKKRPRR